MSSMVTFRLFGELWGYDGKNYHVAWGNEWIAAEEKHISDDIKFELAVRWLTTPDWQTVKKLRPISEGEKLSNAF